MSHTSSRTWVAPKTIEQEKYGVVYQNLKKMEFIPRSPFVPRNINEWLDHRIAFAEDARSDEAKRLHNKQTRRKLNSSPAKAQIHPAFGGRVLCDLGRSPVLSSLSIWSPWYVAGSGFPQAPWPSIEEMKEEGDERNTSGFGRFPPLPRVPGNETVVWKQRQVVEAFPLDRVWEFPWLGPIRIDESSSMEELIGDDLLGGIDY